MASSGEQIEIEGFFPGLRDKEWRPTSPRDTLYNCIAWAAGDTSQWWWPADPADGAFWPAGVERVETLAAFVAVYATLGFTPCADAGYESGVEKVAVFAGADGVPTHAARQLTTGRWTSKLGNLADIEHDLLDICGEWYGTVACLMRRMVPELPG